MIRLSAFADEASPEIRGQIEAMRRNGISLLEIRGVDGTNISKITADKAKEVRRMLDDRARYSRLGLSPRIGQRDFEARALPEIERACKERGARMPHPYVCWLGFQACMRYELGELVRGLSAVADADVELKSGGQARQVLTRMLVRIVKK